MIVIDIESTCSKDNETIFIQDRETIEIGAVDVCLRTGNIVREFVSFVRPIKNEKLTQFCTDLTGITQDDVDSADGFPEVWVNKFLPWLKGEKEFCSWGRYDSEQFKRDCERYDLPPYFEKHCDLSKVAGRNKRLVMKRLGVIPQSRQHRGLDDSKNVAGILGKILEKGIEIQFKNLPM